MGIIIFLNLDREDFKSIHKEILILLFYIMLHIKYFYSKWTLLLSKSTYFKIVRKKITNKIFIQIVKDIFSELIFLLFFFK